MSQVNLPINDWVDYTQPLINMNYLIPLALVAYVKSHPTFNCKSKFNMTSPNGLWMMYMVNVYMFIL